jgi:Na+/H+-dicarboxylate symporter
MNKNRLTLYILIAMAAGIIVGYLMHEVGTGHKINYSPAKDYTGKDALTLVLSGREVVQPIEVVKDSTAYRETKAAFGTWVVVANTNEAYEVDKQFSLNKIKAGPAHGSAAIKAIQSFSDNIKLLTTIFLRLVQMIIAPLVFCTLVVGIAKLGDLKTVGRVGGKALLWFISASLVSLLLGMLIVNLAKPGHAIELKDMADTAGAKDLIGKTQEFSLARFVEHVFPKSVIEAMANNEILQIVIFSIFFGVAMSALGNYAKAVLKALDAVSHVILKMVGYVMNFAPLGVFGAIAAVIAAKGLEVFVFYGKYLLFFLIGIALLWTVLLTVGYLILGKRLGALVKRIASPMLVAFSTTSSEAVFPKLTEELEAFGCKDKIVSFILPLGYSFNLDGSMMYMTFASLAIAQAYAVPLDLGTQLTMLLVLMLTSKGIAGVPRASLVVVTATCAMFKIPPEGVALILPIDHFCDMFRTMTNVVGNALATSVVSKWEGELKPEQLPVTGSQVPGITQH